MEVKAREQIMRKRLEEIGGKRREKRAREGMSREGNGKKGRTNLQFMPPDLKSLIRACKETFGECRRERGYPTQCLPQHQSTEVYFNNLLLLTITQVNSL